MALAGNLQRGHNVASEVRVTLEARKEVMVNKKEYFYVYRYIDKINSIPMYIGKGKSDRKDMHMRAAKKGERSQFYDRIRELNFEEGVIIELLKDNMLEHEALKLEVVLIEKHGCICLGTGTLYNLTSGGEGISGGIDKYGYRKEGIARKITDMVDKGILIQDMPKELNDYIRERGMTVQWKEERIIPHIQEMGNVGCHYKGPNVYLRGWQFSLNGSMVDVNELNLETKGFLKVHGDLPFNEGFVSNPPSGYDHSNQSLSVSLPKKIVLSKSQEGETITSITLKGIVSHSGRGNDAVVFIDRVDQKQLLNWWKENKIETALESMIHPITGKNEPQINANAKAKVFDDRTPVNIVIDIRPWKKTGVDRNGIKILDVVRIYK